MSVISQYCSFLRLSLKYDIKSSVFFKELISECYDIGTRSFFLTSGLSLIIGFMTTSLSFVMLNGLPFPNKTIPIGIKNTIFLELAPTIMCLVFIGKNMTSITSNLFFIKENNFDKELKSLGINHLSFICLPKICASVISLPLLTIYSCLFSLLGGYLYCFFSNTGMGHIEFLNAYISSLNIIYITFCLIKSVVFGFFCSSIACFIGIYKENGNKTDIVSINQNCFTSCCFVVLIADIIINGIKASLHIA